MRVENDSFILLLIWEGLVGFGGDMGLKVTREDRRELAAEAQI